MPESHPLTVTVVIEDEINLARQALLARGWFPAESQGICGICRNRFPPGTAINYHPNGWIAECCVAPTNPQEIEVDPSTPSFHRALAVALRRVRYDAVLRTEEEIADMVIAALPAPAPVVGDLRERIVECLGNVPYGPPSPELVGRIADAAISVVGPELAAARRALADEKERADQATDADLQVAREHAAKLTRERDEARATGFPADWRDHLDRAGKNYTLTPPWPVLHRDLCKVIESWLPAQRPVCAAVHPHYVISCDDAPHPDRAQHHSANDGIYWLSPCPGCSLCQEVEPRPGDRVRIETRDRYHAHVERAAASSVDGGQPGGDRPFDLDNALREVVKYRENAYANPLHAETLRLADQITAGFRRDFGTTLDLDTCGKALMIASASVVPVCGSDPLAVTVANMIGLAGEGLIHGLAHG